MLARPWSRVDQTLALDASLAVAQNAIRTSFTGKARLGVGTEQAKLTRRREMPRLLQKDGSAAKGQKSQGTIEFSH